MGPRLLVKTTLKGITNYVKELYGDDIFKKYHLDNLFTWVECNSRTILAEEKKTHPASKEQDKNAMTCKGFPDQRPFFLNRY